MANMLDIKSVPVVAIVDDDPDSNGLLMKAFSMRKIPVSFVARNGLEAIDMFRKVACKPDVIIMDHRMPVANGVVATRKILSLDPCVKIVFLSADESISDAALEAGAVKFLKKPASMSTILSTVYEAS